MPLVVRECATRQQVDAYRGGAVEGQAIQRQAGHAQGAGVQRDCVAVDRQRLGGAAPGDSALSGLVVGDGAVRVHRERGGIRAVGGQGVLTRQQLDVERRGGGEGHTVQRHGGHAQGALASSVTAKLFTAGLNDKTVEPIGSPALLGLGLLISPVVSPATLPGLLLF